MRKIAYPRGAWFAQCRHLCFRSSGRLIRALRREIIEKQGRLDCDQAKWGRDPSTTHYSAITIDSVQKRTWPILLFTTLPQGGRRDRAVSRN